MSIRLDKVKSRIINKYYVIRLKRTNFSSFRSLRNFIKGQNNTNNNNNNNQNGLKDKISNCT